MGADDFKKYCSSPWDAVILLMVPAEKLRPPLYSTTVNSDRHRANRQCSIEERS